MKKNHRAVRSLDIRETTPHSVLISGCKHRDPFTDLRSGGHVGVGAGDISEDVFGKDRKRTDGQQHNWEEAADALGECFNHLIDAVLYHKRYRGRTEVLVTRHLSRLQLALVSDANNQFTVARKCTTTTLSGAVVPTVRPVG